MRKFIAMLVGVAFGTAAAVIITAGDRGDRPGAAESTR